MTDTTSDTNGTGGSAPSAATGPLPSEAAPWLDSYPSGVPRTVDAERYRSIAELFKQSIAEFGDGQAFVNFGKSLSFNELDARSAEFAGFLNARGLAKGDRIALMMPNVLQYVVAMFGALRAGLVVVNTNPLYTARELRHQLKDSGAKAIVVMDNFASVVQEVLPDSDVELVITTRMGDMLGLLKGTVVSLVVKYVKKMVPAFSLPGAVRFNAALDEGRRAGFSEPEIGPGDTAFLQYTGGTTGVAKGAMLTHRNMVANVEQSAAWIGQDVAKGAETIVTALPLYHIFALTANCFTFMRFGAKNVLITNPRDIPAFVKELGEHKVTAMTGVNTLFNALLNNEDFNRLDFSSLKVTLGGGMAVQRPVAEKWKEVTGVTLVEAYGLTETSPAVCINPLSLAEYNGCIGLPIPSTSVAVRDPQGQELPPGEPGELWVRGPQVMAGYWQRPEETAKCLNDDGWLNTGDIALVEAGGFVRLVDRKKDMIVVSGFNVYPNEVEEVLAMHDDVLEVGVIGVADERSGEGVCAVVVPKAPGLTEATLQSHCKTHLTAYKRPKTYIFAEELPKSNVGKILRRELRDQYAPTQG